MVEVNKMRKQLVEAGRLREQRDIELFDALADEGHLSIMIFSLLIGGMVAIISRNGGMAGVVEVFSRYARSPRSSQFITWVLGVAIFFDDYANTLIVGNTMRKVTDQFKVSREKLAYLIDATSAPVCVMVPLNAWTAVIIGLIASTGIENAFGVFVKSIPYNLYAIFAIILAFVVILKKIDIGPMKPAEIRTSNGKLSWQENEGKEALNAMEEKNSYSQKDAVFMIFPILTMTFAMPAGLFLTGDGNLMKGSGSTAIFWSICAALFVCWCMLLSQKRSNVNELMKLFMEGAGNLLPIAAILLMALALGDVAKLLGTGPYVADVAGANVPYIFLAPLVFLVSGFIAFSVGSSWGTFAIMIPIALSIASNLDLSTSLMLGAALSGGIFGDHASPISDTTVVASMAAGTDHIEHVRTQLPYALIAGFISIIGFILLSIIP